MSDQLNPFAKKKLIYKILGAAPDDTKNTYESLDALSPELLEFNAQIYGVDGSEESKLRALDDEVKKWKTLTDHHRLKLKMAEVEQFQSENSAAETLNVDSLNPDYLNDNISDYKNYISSAKDGMEFILPEFRDVPFFSQNLLLLGACSGSAKTHTGIEAMHSVLRNKNKRTGNPGRVLFITNEETSASIISRLAFRWMKWQYTSLQNITPEQQQWVLKFQDTFTKNGQLVVIDDNYPGISKTTTTIEGLESILSSVKRNGNHFDCIIIDYFHKIAYSKANSGESDVNVLTKVCDRLDYYRKYLASPILVLAQLHPEDSEKDSFELRIKGRKRIYEAATFVAEIVMDRKTRITTFKIEKNRLASDTVGTEIPVGYANGRYVSVDSSEFKQQRELNQRMLEESKEKELGLSEKKERKEKQVIARQS